MTMGSFHDKIRDYKNRKVSRLTGTSTDILLHSQFDKEKAGVEWNARVEGVNLA